MKGNSRVKKPASYAAQQELQQRKANKTTDITVAAGKIAKFKSLDDIPDELPDSFWGARDVKNTPRLDQNEDGQEQDCEEDYTNHGNTRGKVSVGVNGQQAPPQGYHQNQQQVETYHAQQQPVGSLSSVGEESEGIRIIQVKSSMSYGYSGASSSRSPRPSSGSSMPPPLPYNTKNQHSSASPGSLSIGNHNMSSSNNNYNYSNNARARGTEEDEEDSEEEEERQREQESAKRYNYARGVESSAGRGRQDGNSIGRSSNYYNNPVQPSQSITARAGSHIINSPPSSSSSNSRESAVKEVGIVGSSRGNNAQKTTTQAQTSSSSAGGGGGARGAPPLPYESKRGGAEDASALSEKDKLAFSKQPRDVSYRPYTLEQYNLIKPKEYVELGKLKPDLNTEELVAKRANLDRVKQFSKNLKSYNKDSLQQQPKLPSAAERRDMEIDRKRRESNRERAIEFARNVPKPKISGGAEGAGGKSRVSGQCGADSDDFDEGMLGFGSGTGLRVGGGKGGGGMYESEAEYKKAVKIQELEAKHDNSKRQIDAIRKSMGI